MNICEMATADGNKKGRKRKSPSDWAREHEEVEVKKKMVDGTESDSLTCKYCSFEIGIWTWEKALGSNTRAPGIKTTC